MKFSKMATWYKDPFTKIKNTSMMRGETLPGARSDGAKEAE